MEYHNHSLSRGKIGVGGIWNPVLEIVE